MPFMTVFLSSSSTTMCRPLPERRCLSGVCQDGAREGLPCRESGSPDETSLDCPPDFDGYYLTLGQGSSDLATTPVAMSAENGLFCPAQRNPGAFGDPRVRRIELDRGPAGNLRDGEHHPAALVDLTCVAATGNQLVDDLSDFPGPQAMSVAGTIQFRE
jgi:hypothetical protein